MSDKATKLPTTMSSPSMPDVELRKLSAHLILQQETHKVVLCPKQITRLLELLLVEYGNTVQKVLYSRNKDSAE